MIKNLNTELQNKEALINNYFIQIEKLEDSKPLDSSIEKLTELRVQIEDLKAQFREEHSKVIQREKRLKDLGNDLDTVKEQLQQNQKVIKNAYEAKIKDLNNKLNGQITIGSTNEEYEKQISDIDNEVNELQKLLDDHIKKNSDPRVPRLKQEQEMLRNRVEELKLEVQSKQKQIAKFHRAADRR